MLALKQNTKKNISAAIRGCLINERKSQKVLYEKYYGYAFKVAYRYITRYNDVAEVVNDGFEMMFKNMLLPDSGRPPYSERCFLDRLRKIIVLAAIAELKRGRSPYPYSESPKQFLESPGPQDADAPFYSEIIGHVKNLPPLYRAVFNMSVIDNFSETEITKHLNITASASTTYLLLARSILHSRIQHNEVHNTSLPNNE